jgi:hypothetical protein
MSNLFTHRAFVVSAAYQEKIRNDKSSFIIKIAQQNEVTSSIPTDIYNLLKLQTLDLSSKNDLKGSLEVDRYPAAAGVHSTAKYARVYLLL